jgi:uncharacterized protein (TIGR00297 family)
VTRDELAWQSKLVLLLTLPVAGTDVVLQTQRWAMQEPAVAMWTLGLSGLLGLVTWKLRAATPGAAAAGFLITANLMFSTAGEPYTPWRTALIPVLAVSLLAFGATRVGRGRKEQLGTAEDHKGRRAAQIAANLGMAVLVSNDAAQTWLDNSRWSEQLAMAAMAALAGAAADTVSSEIGQVLGGQPRMLTTLRAAEPGTDGAISLAGTLAGVVAAAITAGLGVFALRGNLTMLWVSCAGGVFGLFFDSLLGATFERAGWLNNDAVNFLSTASAAAIALGLMVLVR